VFNHHLTILSQRIDNMSLEQGRAG
jgi:hypothetical protein